MRVLLVGKQEKNGAAFLEAVQCLVARGHEVVVGVQERDDARDLRWAQHVGSDRFRVVRCPPGRDDAWAPVATTIRRLRDAVHYLAPPFQQSPALQTRIFHKLRQDLGLPAEAGVLLPAFRQIPSAQIARLETVLRLAEHSLPTAALFDEFIASHRPDVLLVTPLVHFGSAQADVAASARRLGIPVWMLLFSWDNLSTKGCLHVEPDLMFVWNERQRTEAEQLHGFPPSRVVIVGAPRFDAFFRLRPALSREQFHTPLGLAPSEPTILYLCSSRIIAPRELDFIGRWVGALRSSTSDGLRRCNVIVRPHPDVALLPDNALAELQRWPGAPRLDARVGRPFEDPRVVVLRTSFKDADSLYEVLAHSTVVVALNTTAELEAGIVGRPVFTVADGADDNQQMTVHFHYLTRQNGGFVSVAHSLATHVEQLEQAFAAGVDTAPIRPFIESFLRPLGIERPVSPLLAEALERAAAERTGPPRETTRVARAVDMPPIAAPAGLVPLKYKAAHLVVRVGSNPARHVVNGRVSLERRTVDWLEQWVNIGDVVYDIGAAFGAYTIIAAKQRGAVVVAFEQSHDLYAALAENLLTNRCHGSVIPVPLALSDQDRLVTLQYADGSPGSERYSVRRTPWRLLGPDAAHPHVQSALVSRLDTVVERYALPPPNHLRVSRHLSFRAVLCGAERTLVQPSLRTVWVRVNATLGDTAVNTLTAAGFRVAQRHERKGAIEFLFVRGVTEGA
jgi:FkbM family methyltransferase